MALDRISRNGALGHEEVLEEVEIFLSALARSLPETRNAKYSANLHQATVNVERLIRHGNISPQICDRVKRNLQELQRRYDNLIQEGTTPNEPDSFLDKIVTGKAGNNRYNIDKNHLEFLLTMGHSVTEIANKGLLGGKLHRNTITKFMKANYMPLVRDRYTTKDDEELQTLLQEINMQFPNSGIREVTAILKTRNPPIIVQRDRVARLLSQINPTGASRRWAQVIPRRTYSVPTPNSLWHIDTHHSLIRWNMVIHGCIDGYSRMIIYLKIHTNNLASTMVTDFLKGLKNFGIPSRVRADHGGEFVHVKTVLDNLNGNEHNSFIQGKSVHNIRIERLWRDVFSKVVNKYYNIFNIMENNQILDVENPIHLGALQHVFASRIQTDLSLWRNAHNNHPVRTEKNKTPSQLWYSATQMTSKENNTAIRNLFVRDPAEYLEIISQFEDIQSLHEPENIKKVLPRFPLPLTDAQLNELLETIPVDGESDHDGVDIYARVLEFVQSCMLE